MPSQPETVRVYSGRRLVSRIEPMIGATDFIACDPALGGVEVEAADRGAHGELEHRHGVVDEGAHGGIPLGDAQLAGVHAVGGDGDERLGGPALVLAERLHRGLLAGGVAVEGEDDLACGPSVSSRMMRRRILMCSMPKAVPQVATAPSTPARWAAMTSV